MKNPYASTLAKASLAAILAGCAAPNVGTNPLVPENLKVPAGQTLSLVSPATGVQIYECGAAKADPQRFEWVFKAPEADLFDLSGKKIGKHYAGPTWESNDGSKVVGEVRARDDGPTATAIPSAGRKASSGCTPSAVKLPRQPAARRNSARRPGSPTRRRTTSIPQSPESPRRPS